ncbi:MAG: SPOR domain-containing protein [Pseudomonadota bacterium]
MPRDYKRRKKKTRPRRRTDERASPVQFLLAGFSLGVIAAAVMYYLLTPTPAPQTAASARSMPPPEEPPPEPATEQTAPASKRDATPKAREVNDDDVRRYPFWDWLVNYEVILPEKNEQLTEPSPQPTVTTPGTYLLQVGAYRREDDAERRKATVALLGIQSKIQRVALDDATFYRVRIGPEADLERVEGLLSRLGDNNIEVLLIRITE